MALSSSATSRFLAQRPFLQHVIGIGKSSSSSSSSSLQKRQQQQQQQQHTPQSVLSFFFGVNYSDPDDFQKNLVHGYCLDQGTSDMPGLWFGGGVEYDALCRSTFSETIRRAGGGRSGGEEQLQNNKKDWQSATIDGCMARMILFDQISRNAFRATPEAFAYEKPALDVARQLAHFDILKQQHDHDSLSLHPPPPAPSAPALEGEIFPPYKSFIVTALMHSESVDDHDCAMQILKQAKHEASSSAAAALPAASGAQNQHHHHHLQAWWDYQISFELEHKHVIDRFGRYPHRNKLKGRTNTPDEEAWLADMEHLPVWAKSQVS